jgi:uncharacterized phage-associated protein
METIDSIILSDYILKHYGPMSHLKLQRLLFYCDAYHLAYFDKELITDKFEAWVHGPVSRKVYGSLKDKYMLYEELTYSNNTKEDVDKEFEKLTQDQQDFVISILEELYTWTMFELGASIRNEKPWKEARIGYREADKCHVEISKETTRLFYKKDLIQ